MVIRVIHLSQTDNAGGASRAALRLHLALRAHGIESLMRVGVNYTDLASVRGPMSRPGWVVNLVRPAAGMALMRLQRTPNKNLHSPAFLPSHYAREMKGSPVDIIHLHGVGAEFMSIGDIGRLRQPVIWTLHDMWPFSGAEHVGDDGLDARWRTGYRRDNRAADHRGVDIDRWTWERKRKAWKTPRMLIAPSNWLGECARASTLMGHWPLRVIPNVLDTKQFRPWPKDVARRILGLPADDIPLLLFGAMGVSKDVNKGWDLLYPALLRLAHSHPTLHLAVFGQSAPASPPSIGLPIHWLGRLHDDPTISLLYSAADITVVPSRLENLPQIATEAQACACPVVAFRTSGLPDAVEHRKTGYLAAPYDSDDLAAGIRWLLDDRELRATLGTQARTRAHQLWRAEAVIPQVVDAYHAAIAHHRQHMA